MKVITLLNSEGTPEEILKNPKEFFKYHCSDCTTLVTKNTKDTSATIMFGYDMYTENEDGSVCNSSNDKPHYYIEVWENWDEDDEGEETPDAPYETYWIEDIDDFQEVLETYYQALDIAYEILYNKTTKEVE